MTSTKPVALITTTQTLTTGFTTVGFEIQSQTLFHQYLRQLHPVGRRPASENICRRYFFG